MYSRTISLGVACIIHVMPNIFNVKMANDKHEKQMKVKKHISIHKLTLTQFQV